MIEKYSKAWYQSYRRRLTRWYDTHHRRLPWRQTSDPYAIWISETMLQQTQVATVIAYYHRFLTRFPTVVNLANADEQEVLSLWAGLGYYRRARQLHAASKIIVERFSGNFPTRFEDVLALPGIGRYTAGAITSFAYDQRAPIVEANTSRLYSRLLALDEPLQGSQAQAQLWEFAEASLPTRQGAGRVNQAAIEVGSQVCKPQPNCSGCPLKTLCRAYATGRETHIPVQAARPVVTDKIHVSVLIKWGNRYLVRRNQPGEWWEALWEFPRADLALMDAARTKGFQRSHPDASANLEIARELLHQVYALDCRPRRFVKLHKHSVTRYRIALYCFEADWDPALVPKRRAKPSSKFLSSLEGQWHWWDLQDSSLPVSSPTSRIRDWLSLR
ncbi:MAG: A/G-specific adenine glycosylase [Pirellulaceae bacterium]